MQVFSYQGSIDTIMSPLDSIRYQKSFLRVGFMSMDPNTGHVKAYVGGPDFTHFQYDMASVGRRQIGSTVKPFLYTLAMEEGFTPCDMFLNEQPTLITEDGSPGLLGIRRKRVWARWFLCVGGWQIRITGFLLD